MAKVELAVASFSAFLSYACDVVPDTVVTEDDFWLATKLGGVLRPLQREVRQDA